MNNKPKPEIIIELERNIIKSVIFALIGAVCISYITVVIIQYTQNRLIILSCMIIQCIVIIALLELDFFKKEVKYKIIEEKETWYGTHVVRERTK